MMDFDHPPPDPLPVFRTWLEEAGALDLPNPNAMTLATADADGRPSARTVLLKGLDARGAVFYSNSRSRKGRELAANPRAALLFHWDALARQIRIEGSVTQVSDEESDAYYASRPRESRLGAWASDQSQPVDARKTLLARLDEARERFAGADVPRPPHWHGYRLAFERIEFWEGRDFRIHDRVVYEREGDAWRTMRLFP
ncbi:MAG: pyridoxamine 5'-phosphate oxidase [Phycisphaerales bacterium]|nr:pyridoxamine 5'-phosphate oxidase [Phycisphaerales bacterium]